MPRHSSIVGGSTAGRLINCPGSYQAQLALPAAIDIPSEYAEEGTAMHEVVAKAMHARLARPDSDSVRLTFNWIGERFHDRELTREHWETMIVPALGHLAALEEKYGGDFEVVGVEQRVRFPGIPGAFGTVDLILASPRIVLHVDWKFGQGVGVSAVYRDSGDSGDEYVNPQLMFYVCGAVNSCRRFYVNRKQLVLAIVQPRMDPPLTDVEVTRQELRFFREDLAHAVVLALDRAPFRRKGEWCRWAPCKVDCPLWTGPLLDLSALQPVERTSADDPNPAYGEYLAKAKLLVDIVAMYKKTLDDQLHAYLEDGGRVPGWRLKAKAKQRQWVDEDVVAKELRKLNFKTDEIWQPKLVTFAAADATARRLNVKIPDTLRVAPPTNETTVCPTDDPAPVVERKKAIEQFAAALQHLRKPA